MPTEQPGRIFGLSFTSASMPNAAPELVLTFEGTAAREIEATISDRNFRPAFLKTDYLEDLDASWMSNQDNLFPESQRCGFGSCGYLQQEAGTTEYRFPLRFETGQQVAATIHLLSHAAQARLYDEEDREIVSNRPQLVSFDTLCERNRSGGYGHAIFGRVYPALRRWLASAKDLAPAEQAMREAWAAVAHPEAREFTDDCRARVHDGGRFIFECPGNACDLAIYPESDGGPESDYPTAFSCHNLDTAPQQITLLVGLATLHQLAEADLG